MEKQKVEKERETKRSRMAMYCFMCLCMSLCIVAMGVLLKHFLGSKGGEQEGIAVCGDCHCIVVGAKETCPLQKPRISFTEQEINTWESLQVVNPFTIDCDPYANATCQTIPPQSQELSALGDTAVCAIHFEETFAEGESSCDGSKYRLATYPSVEQAQRMGGFVTHTGHCGVCSTLQDLAAYIRVADLTTQGTWCTVEEAILGGGAGTDCYDDLGFTEDCAKIWSLNSWNTARKCATECWINEAVIDSPNNGPAPNCTLNDCLQCDEEKSVPTFRRFAGRNRRSSGLLSEIARPCDQLVNITQEACPATLPI